MKKVNSAHLPPDPWSSPTGKFAGSDIELSIALGRDPDSTDLLRRHPFDVAISTLPPGKTAFPYHSHSAQWEFYHVLSGHGLVRDPSGETPIGPGDAFLFPPGEPHQIRNSGDTDLVFYIIADNPIGESCYYPDSQKWLVRSPQRRLLRSDPIDYWDGED